MRNIELSYTPFVSNGSQVTDEAFTLYCEQSGLGDLVTKLVIDPIEERLKARRGEEVKIGKITLSRTEKSGTSTSWKGALEGIARFLEVRADDARAEVTEGCTYVEGVGYCMSLEAWGSQLEKQIETNTNPTSGVTIGWPQFKKTDPAVRRIEVPYTGLREVDEETVKLAIRARQFRSSLARELIDPFKEANKIWHVNETGYDDDKKIPSKEASPIPRARQIARGKYVLVQLVRVEDCNYKEIIEGLQEDREELQEGKPVKGYRTKVMNDKPYVNIKTIQQRLGELRRDAENVKARYEIVP